MLKFYRAKNSRRNYNRPGSLVGGVLNYRIVYERWDGKFFKIRLRAKADPKELADKIDRLAFDPDISQDILDSAARKAGILRSLNSIGSKFSPERPPDRDYLTYSSLINRLGAEQYIARGLAYEISGRFDRAIEVYSAVIGQTPNNSPAYLARGRSHFRQDRGKTRPMDAKLEKNESKKPEQMGQSKDKPEVGAKPVDAYSKFSFSGEGRFEEAISDFNQAIKLRPGNAPAYYHRGRAFQEDGQIEKARSDLEQFIKLAPSDSRGPKQLDTLAK